MDKPFNGIPDYRKKEERKKEEPTIPKKPCLVCQKLTFAYGRWEEGFTCSSKCEREYTTNFKNWSRL